MLNRPDPSTRKRSRPEPPPRRWGEYVAVFLLIAAAGVVMWLLQQVGEH